MEKSQFNTWVRPTIKEATERIARASEFSKSDIVEIALASLLGTSDELMLAKRNKVQKIAAEMGVKCTFKAAQLSLELSLVV